MRYIYIYLLYYKLNPATAESARIDAKEREKKEGEVRRAKKRIEAQRAKPSTLSQAIEAHIGDEEQNGKQKKNKKKETSE